MQTLYTSAKVNNEIELCEVNNPQDRREIEKALLKNRISYYIRWPKKSIFSKKKDACIICINENSSAEAEDIVQAVCDELGIRVRFIMRRSRYDYLEAAK